MARYKVLGVLGSVVAIVDSIDDVISTVRTQIPLTDKKAKQLANRVAKCQAGGYVGVDYGGSGCEVEVLE